MAQTGAFVAVAVWYRFEAPPQHRCTASWVRRRWREVGGSMAEAYTAGLAGKTALLVGGAHTRLSLMPLQIKD